MSPLLAAGEVANFDEQFASIRELDPSNIIPPDDRHQYGIQDVKVGGFFTYGGNTFVVRQQGTYSETSENFERDLDFTWPELQLYCIETGKTMNLEWEEDDGIQVSMTTDRIGWRDLTDTTGDSIDEDDLDDLADEQDIVVYLGQRYQYDDDYAARYQGTGKEAEHVYFYDFEGSGGKTLTVEAWEIDRAQDHYEYQMYISQEVQPRQIEVLTLGGGE